MCTSPTVVAIGRLAATYRAGHDNRRTTVHDGDTIRSFAHLDAERCLQPRRVLRPVRRTYSGGGQPGAVLRVCLLLVIVWLVHGAIEIVVKGRFSAFLDGQYQLEINTTTTIITFLMVALLQNSQTRSDLAIQHKLNAIADGMADLMEHIARRDEDRDLRADIRELRLAVGLENIESSGDQA
jgi:low affinity Fe/Cu permease